VLGDIPGDGERGSPGRSGDDPDDTPGEGGVRASEGAAAGGLTPAPSEPAAGTLPLGLQERAIEFGRFLRNRRARITPEEVGFPSGTRRRSSGLRREEVAILAGLSPTWYAYLEQGRKVRPSPEVLDSLARVLSLSHEECRYMYLLALGYAPPAPAAPPVSQGNPLLGKMIDIIGAGPYPVYVGNQYADVVAWNEATTAWYTDFGALPPPHRNMLWWLLTAPEAKERIVNWEEDVRDVVARLRLARAARPQDPELHCRLRTLAQASPDFRRWWSEHDVRDQHTRLRHLCAPGLGSQTFQLVTLRLADDAFNSALVHIPVDGG